MFLLDSRRVVLIPLLKRGKQSNLGKESQIQPAGKVPKANFRSYGWSCLFGTSCNSRRRSLIRRTSCIRGDFASEQQSPVIVTSGKLIFLEMRNKSWCGRLGGFQTSVPPRFFVVGRSPSSARRPGMAKNEVPTRSSLACCPRSAAMFGTPFCKPLSWCDGYPCNSLGSAVPRF
jgi:hypothetical protein